MKMKTFSDQVIAHDVLISDVAALQMYTNALSETYSEEVRDVLREQLDETISMHEQITNYMKNQGWYHPHDPVQQMKIVQKQAETALELLRQ